ncbi:hypothetical protein PsorP6_001354 [Peronosclerospora sorghi]|uniref:Uncharacterized protein n=1 Tax=Peronosclerospora sorghi TaxID=230839 RepID=A0ACC0WSG6_9STRA|nr:hypothetical protein PsorP6_001354 [Peronosclerospora sorghi]
MGNQVPCGYFSLKSTCPRSRNIIWDRQDTSKFLKLCVLELCYLRIRLVKCLHNFLDFRDQIYGCSMTWHTFGIHVLGKFRITAEGMLYFIFIYPPEGYKAQNALRLCLGQAPISIGSHLVVLQRAKTFKNLVVYSSSPSSNASFHM